MSVMRDNTLEALEPGPFNEEAVLPFGDLIDFDYRHSHTGSWKVVSSLCDDIDIPASNTPPEPASAVLNEQGLYSYLQTLEFSAKELNLYPKRAWTASTVTFIDMYTNHFQCKSNRKVKFEHKLWNALQLTSLRPDLYPLVGVIWLSDSIIQVNRISFGRLLGLEKSTSALFNVQGSFPTHGFDELTLDEVKQTTHVNSPSPDFSECRFFVRKDGLFSRFSPESDVSLCTYTKPSYQ